MDLVNFENCLDYDLILPKCFRPSKEFLSFGGNLNGWNDYFGDYRLLLIDSGFEITVLLSSNFHKNPHFGKFFNPEAAKELESKIEQEDYLDMVELVRNTNGFSWDSENCRLGFLVNNFIHHLSEIYNRKSIAINFVNFEEFVQN